MGVLIYLGILIVLAYLYVDYDHPFLLATISRALYVDEGFYSDAAQNFIRFGVWDLPHDSRHWPGTPFATLLQTMVFSVFGVSITVVRMICVVSSAISGLALFFIARTTLSNLFAFLLVVVAMLNFNFVAFSRSAVIDPIASCLMLLSLLAFIKIKRRHLALVMSLLLAYFALLSKMYFLFVIVALCILWGFELVVIPMFKKRIIDRSSVVLFVVTLIFVGGSFVLMRQFFHAEFSHYIFMVGDKFPSLDIHYLYTRIIKSMDLLWFTTKNLVFICAILLVLGYQMIMLLTPRSLRAKLQNTGKIHWQELAMMLVLLLGLGLISLSTQHKDQYFYFSLLLIPYASAVIIYQLLPRKLGLIAIIATCGYFLFNQYPYYAEWFGRTQKTAIYDASVATIELIEQNSTEDMIPVIGEYSAELGLYSKRLQSLDVKWVSLDKLCKRIEYWRPKFHVNVVWPNSASSTARDILLKCDVVTDYQEINRFSLFEPRKDELVLTRLEYKL